MLSNSSSTPLRPWAGTSYSLLNGFVTPFHREVPPTVPEEMSLNEFKKLNLAGLYMRTAVTPGRSVVHLTTMDAIQRFRTYYSPLSQFIIWASLLGLLLLTFFEDGPSKIPESVTFPTEFLCLTMLSWKMLEKRSFMGEKNFAHDAASIIHVCILALLWIDFLIGISPHPIGTNSPHITSAPTGPPLIDDDDEIIVHRVAYSIYRYGRALRPFLMMDHAPSVQHRLIDLCVAGWRARTTFLLVAFNVIFFAVIATILFHDPDTDTEDSPFSGMEESLVTLIILQTTSNSPGVFVPYFYDSRFTSLFFIAFLIISHFLLLNLVLGVIYHEHTQRLRTAARDELLDSYVAARASMAVLCDDIGTNKGEEEVDFYLTCKMLCMEFSILESSARKLLHRCGATVDGVTREQFCRIPRALRLKLSSFSSDFVHEDSDADEDEAVFQVGGQQSGRSSSWRSMANQLRSKLRYFFQLKIDSSNRFGYVDAFIVGSLLAMLGSLIIEISSDFDAFIDREERGYSHDPFTREFWSYWLTIAFVVELLLKLFAVGFYRYTDDLWNIFDTVCVLVSLIGVTWFFSPKASVLLSEVRNFRLFRVIPGFRSVVGIAAAFAPAIGPSVAAILCVFYTTAVIVVGVLGNIRLLPESYRANDFRDFSAALVTLFELSIVNDWNSTMAAFVEATGTKVVRIFFIAWWAISQPLLYNTVTSLVLDGFEVRMKELNALQKPSAQAPDRGLTPMSPSLNEFRQITILRSLSSDFRSQDGAVEDEPPIAPFLRGTSFTVGRMFLELFRDITEPEDLEVDIACWERGIHVGKAPFEIRSRARE